MTVREVALLILCLFLTWRYITTMADNYSLRRDNDWLEAALKVANDQIKLLKERLGGH